MSEHDPKLTPDEHSDIVGGSTAGRVLACPGSVQLNQAVKRAHKLRILAEVIEENGLASSLELDHLPADVAAKVEAIYRAETTSSYAAEGTGLHEAMAWILENDEEPESVVDRTFEGIFITPTLFSECVLPALQGFDDYCDMVFEEDGEELVFTVEKRCQVPGIPGAFGTSDIIGKTSKRMVIWDWKFGAGKPVSPVENDQLRFYGRGAAHTMKEWLGFSQDQHGFLDAAGNNLMDLRVDLIISQPRIGDGKPQVWTTTYQDLEDFRWRLVSAVAEAMGKDARVKRGDHCLWCEAKHVCPAKQQLMNRILARVDDAKDAAEEKDGSIDMAAAAALKASEVQFTPQDIADWLEDAEDAEAWVKWVRSLAYAELTAGREVAGKELDRGLGNAAWTEDEKTVDRRLASYGLSVEDRRVTSPISPTVARKHAAIKDDPKKAKLLEKMITRPPSAPKIVDKGTAKNPVRPQSEQVASLGKKLAAREGEE
jgi:hypothetical protein